MTDRIEPGLTSRQMAEWLEEPTGFAMVDLVTFGRSAKGITIGPTYAADGLPFSISTAQIPTLIALANAALPDTDDRKTTLEKVANIRNAADALAGNDGGGRRDAFDAEQDRLAAAALHAFADALASYLPPE